MTRRALLLTLAALALATPALASERHPTLAELEHELICPTCHTTLDQSDSPIARRMKVFVLARIRAGETKSEIKRKLVDEFGVGVLAEPPRSGFHLLAWLLPLVGVIGAAVVVGVLAWRWSRSREPLPPLVGQPAAGLSPELERRVDDELLRFD